MSKARPPSAGRTLGDVAFESLRADIVRGVLAPGSKLRFDSLRRRYQLNVGALREGLSRLAAQGLVIGRSQRGYHVAPLSDTDLADVTALRSAIDSLALRLALERGDMEWEKQVISASHELSRTPRRDPRKPQEPNEQWQEKHRAFHFALLSGCASPFILQMHATLFDRAERYRRAAFKQRLATHDWSSGHEALAHAALNRSDDAVQLLLQHISGVARRLGGRSRTPARAPAASQAARARRSPTSPPRRAARR